jgi:hypothetical protein
MKNKIFVLAITTILGLAQQAVADDQFTLNPDPLDVRIESILSNGTACPGGLSPSEIVLTDDASALLVNMGVVGATNGGDLRSIYKSCSISLRLVVPAGWTWRISGASFSYGARMAEGKSGLFKLESWIQGSGTENDSAEVAVSGPVAVRGQASAIFTGEAFAPCDGSRALNFKSSVRVDQGPALASLRWLGPVAWNIEWKRCEP